jgi:hypothetical protein
VPIVIAAAPVLLAGATLAAVLDPILFGVIPASPGQPHSGDPAAWYIIAQWDWPAAPSEY